jgi:hypothetical protein
MVLPAALWEITGGYNSRSSIHRRAAWGRSAPRRCFSFAMAARAEAGSSADSFLKNAAQFVAVFLTLPASKGHTEASLMSSEKPPRGSTVRLTGSHWENRPAARRRSQPERAPLAQPGRMTTLGREPQSQPYLFGLIRTYLGTSAILPPKRRGCLELGEPPKQPPY